MRADPLAPHPLAALIGGARRGLDLATELVVVPEPGDDLLRVLVGELVRDGAGRFDERANVVPEVVVLE